ncbi:spore coat U domain-containing protein [Aquabacterium sp. J223]|uniref:Csu type fimbrial protein n=1 Tax=Aquabacterium sp. J223 TaxID=2898431 RepID=UPI0021AD95BC|nr:spore coat U domain-containing protein [Aquabacterium sp. J223]UUX97688.1 spore coat U domain-containing protein [Aquabacterium sp. J223]
MTPSAPTRWPADGAGVRRRFATAARALLAVLALWWSLPAAAVCLPAVCTCSVSTQALSFGTVNPLGGAVDSTGKVTVNCGGVVGLLIPLDVQFGAGSGSFGTRMMKSGAHQLAYNLYGDPARTAIVGDGTAGTLKMTSSILLDVLRLAPPLVMTVYGRMPGPQPLVAPGVYTDTLSVMVTYY